MKSSMKKTTLREIRTSLGRFLAIAAIMALGVGVFAGLKNTTEDMVAETDRYLSDLHFFDYRLVSSYGFTDRQLSVLEDEEIVKAAVGEYASDVIIEPLRDGDTASVLSVHSLCQNVNEVKLVKGRMPVTEGEMLLEARNFDEDIIGTEIRLSHLNPEENREAFSEQSFVVVGIVHSPLYLNYERGTTRLLSGSVDSYAYVLPEAFALPAYTSLYCIVNDGEKIYSDAYQAHMDRTKDTMDNLLEKLQNDRLEELKENMLALMGAGALSANETAALAEGTDPVSAMLPDAEDAFCYLLDRQSNIGYVCFDNDANIVDGIAKVFPLFFILVAALVVMTTMNRMVEEQRTQMGVLKALGYSAASIAGKYLVYSGTASVIGCLFGFFGGCYLFPTVIWKVYAIMYGFTDELVYVFNPKLFIISLAVAFVCSCGITILTIAKEIRAVPAELIRPRAPKNGRRILLERVGFFWKRLPFLHKVSLRNVVRYRKRFFMMTVGIAGCTALLITGHGIRDSITSVPTVQYDEIERYDYEVSIKDISEKQAFEKETVGSLVSDVEWVARGTMNVRAEGKSKTKSVDFVIPEKETLRFVTLTDEKRNPIGFPEDGACVLSGKIAGQLGISEGDVIECQREGEKPFSVKVSGIFRNYVGDVIYMSTETFEEGTGTSPEFLYAYARKTETGDVYENGAGLLNRDDVATVSVNRQFRDRIEAMLSRLDYIVLLVIFCAAALAFIVLYNLTNINITERIREIATIKVLGFYSMETSMYVFRENFILTAIGAVCGIPLGILLHRFVMSQIQVDLVSFNVHVSLKSFLLSLMYTFLFAIVVDIVMHRKLEKINMAESMKSIE